jgi:LmbE family N-acetylglucosaminyl deacetylase/CheY-like chemotaxis protein
MPNEYARKTPLHGIAAVQPPLVLIVEDDDVAVEMYRTALTSDGAFAVLHAGNAEQAIEHLHLLSAIACVVTDINLPGADGFEVLKASKMLRPQTPVLLVTASTNPRVPTQAVREGADEFLMKPLDLQELRSSVARLVQRAVTQREAQARTVLAVGAHPDDVEIGIAGTLLSHVAGGDRVIHLMMTDGESGGHRDVRIAEAERAAQAMGVTLVRGSQPDGFLSDTREIVNLIAGTIREFNPSIVYVHSVNDGHQDHRATFHATISAARGVPTLCCYQSPSATVDFRPSRYVDIGAYLDRKIDLINIYRSQTSTRLYLAEDMIRATARYWGRHAAHRVVEPLEVVWQLTP